jgi:hypothetical protein
VVVRPSQNLDTLTQAHPKGTTFWLAPGVHHLGRDEYDQVQPKAGNRYVGAPGAVLSGRHVSRIAFGGQAADVHLEFLTVEDFGRPGDNNNEGAVNHDGGTGWVFSHLTIKHNAGAGVLLGDDNVVESSCLLENGQYGFSAFADDGVQNLALRHNEIARNNTDDWEVRQPGCGCTGGGKFWDVRNASVTGNYVHDNRGVGLWADMNNAGFLFRGNFISDNADEGLVYEVSYNAAVIGNTFVRNGITKGPTIGAFPTGAIYISESGSDPRVATAYSSSFQVAHNTFLDNWGGVVLWENADRFAGSPANPTTDYGTLVNPNVTVSKCGRPELVKTKPYFNDCRWKTQNVKVHDNTFSFDARSLGPHCTQRNACGYNGLFSNYGTYPDWSPYHERVVQKNIAFYQNNTWSDNTYIGPWRFMVFEMGSTAPWDTWRGAPYRQDAGSTLR